jgi:hypothetical protein
MVIEKYVNIQQSCIVIDGKTKNLPEYFPSISSVKTSLLPIEYLRVLAATKYPQFLISAYDLCNSDQNKKMAEISMAAKKNGAIILMDSGNYESYWRSDREWKWNNYLDMLDKSHYHLAFSFDNQTPPDTITKNVLDIEKRTIKTLKKFPQASIIPILHGSLLSLPQISTQVVHCLKPIMIAVPERELGEGLIERIKTLTRIRRALEETGENVPLHLLGTGNPLALLLFSIFGANSFDGLEWCQTTVNHETGLLYHFQHRELFGNQSVFCGSKDIPYAQATLAHNLMFYSNWMSVIRANIKDGKVEELLKKYFLPEFLSTLTATLEEN